MDKIDKIIKETLRNSIDNVLNEGFDMVLNEGIDIDTTNRIVSFNNAHQDNVDTNDYIHPYIISNTIRNNKVLSIFERKDNDEGNDGNPLVYALKNIRGWRFANPKHDIMALLRRFISVTTSLQMNFDTLILTPSNNDLNNKVFSYLMRLLNFDNSFSSLFRKLTVSEVYENYYDENYFDSLSEIEAKHARMEMNKAFRSMNLKNNGVFSYKYISTLAYRESIERSLSIEFDDDLSMQYRNAINGKNVLVLDDTVASGKTLSDSAEAIRSMFDPLSITFLTLFSPKSSQGFKNIKTSL
jgi:hypothetical protein